MSFSTKQLPCAELTMGMVVAEPVHTFSGQELIAVGTPLQVEHLRGLKLWGIKTVTVLGEQGLDIKELGEVAQDSKLSADANSKEVEPILPVVVSDDRLRHLEAKHALTVGLLKALKRYDFS